ncbi:MAG: hypothetical protein HON94_07895 [Methylococcales bacterium]|jgi:hypothetical protein|nr:hypothetical protein [Methylococcales bacterium]MBT7408813.1 hypothetical protein [Methylococcales bacterium]
MTMPTQPEDDFDDFLQQQSDISQLYQQTKTTTVPKSLDKKILQIAKQQTQPVVKKTSIFDWLNHHWQAPLASAFVILMSAGLLIQIPELTSEKSFSPGNMMSEPVYEAEADSLKDQITSPQKEQKKKQDTVLMKRKPEQALSKAVSIEKTRVNEAEEIQPPSSPQRAKPMPSEELTLQPIFQQPVKSFGSMGAGVSSTEDHSEEQESLKVPKNVLQAANEIKQLIKVGKLKQAKPLIRQYKRSYPNYLYLLKGIIGQ